VRVQTYKAVVAAAVFFAFGLGAAWGQAQPQAKQPQWKDRAEYDLAQSIAKEPDPNKKLALLDQWKEKYPESDLKENRLETYLDTYQALNQPAKMLENAQLILALDPKNMKALYWTNLLVVSMNDTAPAKLELGEKAAQQLLAAANDFFAPEKKPAATPEAAWQQAKASMDALAHRTLGWVAMQRKDYAAAEKEFAEDIKLNAADGESAYWMGTVILVQKKVERQPEAVFYFARAAAFDGTGPAGFPGALDPARRKQIEAYVQKAYVTYHGSDHGFADLLQMAKAHPFPPQDFKIQSADEVKAQGEAQLAKENPSLAFWLKLKDALTSPEGAQYFDTGMKNAIIPPEGQPELGGTVISATPAAKPTVLVLGVEKPDVPDATLKFETPLTVKVEPGTKLQFRGVAESYTATPFMVTFATEKKNVIGLPSPPPPARKAPVHKGAAKKKQ